MYRALLFFLIFSTYGFASFKIQILPGQKFVLIHLVSKDSFMYTGKESLPAGAIFNLKGKLQGNASQLMQAPVQSVLVHEYIFQPLTKNQYQLILNRLQDPEYVYAQYYVDSLYHLKIFVINKKWVSNDPTALYLQGLEYEKKRKPFKAVQYYRKAIRIAGKHGNAYYRAGIIRLNQGRIRDAEINFTKAITQNTDSVGVYLYLAKLYKQKKQYDLAAKYQKKYDLTISLWKKMRTTPQVEKSSGKLAETKKMQTSSSNLKIYILLGFLLLLFGIGFWVYQMKRSTEIENVTEEDEEPVELTDREKEFLDLLQKKKQEINNVSEEMLGKTVASITSESTGEKPVQPVTSDETEPPDEKQDEKIQKAKELNVGVGELDLALNLKAKMRNKHKLTSQEDLILEMYREGMRKEEIARKLQINYGEVDLVIELNKHKLNS
jgi:tetratricopeptide (TPR) repeat protein